MAWHQLGAKPLPKPTSAKFHDPRTPTRRRPMGLFDEKRDGRNKDCYPGVLSLSHCNSLEDLAKLHWLDHRQGTRTVAPSMLLCNMPHWNHSIAEGTLSLGCRRPEVMIPSNQAVRGDRNGGSAPLFRQRITIDWFVPKRSIQGAHIPLDSFT